MSSTGSCEGGKRKCPRCCALEKTILYFFRARFAQKKVMKWNVSAVELRKTSKQRSNAESIAESLCDPCISWMFVVHSGWKWKISDDLDNLVSAQVWYRDYDSCKVLHNERDSRRASSENVWGQASKKRKVGIKNIFGQLDILQIDESLRNCRLWYWLRTKWFERKWCGIGNEMLCNRKLCMTATDNYCSTTRMFCCIC